MKTIILALSALALSGAAHAEDRPTQEVFFTPEALASVDGQASIRDRILEAAEAVCIAPGARGLEMREARRTCIEEAVTDAEAQLESKLAQAEGARYARRDGLLSGQG